MDKIRIARLAGYFSFLAGLFTIYTVYAGDPVAALMLLAATAGFLVLGLLIGFSN